MVLQNMRVKYTLNIYIGRPSKRSDFKKKTRNASRKNAIASLRSSGG